MKSFIQKHMFQLGIVLRFMNDAGSIYDGITTVRFDSDSSDGGLSVTLGGAISGSNAVIPRDNNRSLAIINPLCSSSSIEMKVSACEVEHWVVMLLHYGRPRSFDR